MRIISNINVLAHKHNTDNIFDSWTWELFSALSHLLKQAVVFARCGLKIATTCVIFSITILYHVELY